MARYDGFTHEKPSEGLLNSTQKKPSEWRLNAKKAIATQQFPTKF